MKQLSSAIYVQFLELFDERRYYNHSHCLFIRATLCADI